MEKQKIENGTKIYFLAMVASSSPIEPSPTNGAVNFLKKLLVSLRLLDSSLYKTETIACFGWALKKQINVTRVRECPGIYGVFRGGSFVDVIVALFLG